METKEIKNKLEELIIQSEKMPKGSEKINQLNRIRYYANEYYLKTGDYYRRSWKWTLDKKCIGQTIQ